MAVNTLGGGGSVSGTLLTGGAFSVLVFTTPATVNYTYEVDLFISPPSIPISSSLDGIEWATFGNSTKSPQATSDIQAYPAPSSGTRILTGGWKTIKCGPSTPVTVSGYFWYQGSSKSYTIAYTYVGYQII